MSFGEASPPNPYEGQYILRIVDLDQQPRNPPLDLHSFLPIAPIDHNLNECLQHIRQNSNKKFMLIIITSGHTPPQIRQMITNDLKPLSNMNILHLFFTNGSRYHAAWRNRHDLLVQSCRSITNNLSRDLRAICSSFCDLNIEYCEDQTQLFEQKGEGGIANDFRTQHLYYVDLKFKYMERQRNELLASN